MVASKVAETAQGRRSHHVELSRLYGLVRLRAVEHSRTQAVAVCASYHAQAQRSAGAAGCMVSS